MFAGWSCALFKEYAGGLPSFLFTRAMSARSCLTTLCMYAVSPSILHRTR